jgi:hypothetical protein
VLSREQFLTSAQPRSKECEVPGLGTIAVREITYREQRAYLELSRSDDAEQRRNAIPWVIAQAVLDKPGGGRLFTDKDIHALGELQAETIAAVFLEIMRFSGADGEAVAREGESSAEIPTPASS